MPRSRKEAAIFNNWEIGEEVYVKVLTDLKEEAEIMSLHGQGAIPLSGSISAKIYLKKRGEITTVQIDKLRKKNFCKEHRTKLVYSDKRGGFFCPFCDE